MRSLACALALAVGATSAFAEDATVTIKNFDFNPMNVTITAGSSVTWKNDDGEPHTVTSVDGAFRSGALDTNQSFTFKFYKTGTYKYLCSIHPKMVGTVTVK
ncbi:MAG TPA: cupredoxin family copper-binding protein [Rhizomicrobium sp.]|nr:cupredoxin family copper-binding protein [Rhizomicrobium sp.]